MKDFQTHVLDNLSVMRLPKRIDFTNTGAFLQAMEREIRAGQRALVLDLQQTELLDSTALGAIVQIMKVLRCSNRRLSIAGPRGAIRRTLMLTRIDSFVSVFATVPAAMASQTSACHAAFVA